MGGDESVSDAGKLLNPPPQLPAMSTSPSFPPPAAVVVVVGGGGGLAAEGGGVLTQLVSIN